MIGARKSEGNAAYDDHVPTTMKEGYTMRALFVLACLCLLALATHAADLTPPLTFRASFDSTIDAQARGEGKPVKVEGPVEYRPGKVGQALLCGEGGAAAQYATAGNLRAAAGTVEMWVCPLDWTGEEDEFHVFLEALDPGWLVLYRYYQGGILTLMGTEPGHYRTASGPQIHWKPGEWHHLAGTWRAARLEVYVDGQRAGFVDSPLIPDKLADTFRVGDHPWHVARKKQTLVDEVKLYSVPLDAESIARSARGEPVQYKPQILVQLTADPVTAILHVTCDAAGLVGDLGTGRTAHVELVPKGKTEVVAHADLTAFPKDVGNCELSVANVPQGEYELRTLLLDDKGVEVAHAVSPFTKPGPPVWSGNTLGTTDKVLPPWTPLKPYPNVPSVECWGRRYDFSSFLKQVKSSEADLLAEPVTLEAVIGGKSVPLNAPCHLESSTASKAVMTGQAEANGFRVAVHHEIEFDGFTWTDLSLEAAQPLRVDELRLTWTMPKTQATLMHADTRKWIDSPAGSIKPDGWSSDWTHFFWLGNEDRGLSWYAETDRNWRHSKERPDLQVVPEGDHVKVIVRLIAEPTDVTSKLEYGFGMMATPARPQPKDARRWRMTPAVRPTFDIVWPNGNMKWYGYTEPVDPQKFTARVKEAHDKGCLTVPYINLNYASAGIPEWQYYGSRWFDPARVVTPGDVAKMGYSSMGTCPAVRDWQDFILYRINEMIDRYQVDGIYIDCWGPSPCQTSPCGWKDEKGALHPTRPIRAYREILKRVYSLFRERRPNPLLMVHMSSEVNIPMLSFTDTILDGEQYRTGKLKDDYLDLLPPDKFRAEFMGRNYGPVDFFLPELRDPNLPIGTPNLAGYLMLHDVNAWPIRSDAKVWNRLYDALDAFGIADARFLPYWQDSGARTDPQVLVSSYVGKSGAVLAVMNTGDAIEAKVTLDLKRLGLKSITGAADVLRDEKMKVEGKALTMPLVRRQGRVIVVSP